MTLNKTFIINTIQDIVNKKSNNPNRRKIVVYNDRINFCCPICGDSTKNDRAKRGNLYFDKLFFICFNDGCKCSLLSLCKTFDIQIDLDKKLELIEYISKDITYNDYKNSDLSDTNLDHLLDLSAITEIFSTGEHNITDFQPVQKNSIIYNYLVSRGIYEEKHTHIYEANYWNKSRYEPIVCFLNRNGDKVLGIQIRNIKDGKYRWFKIFNYETLAKWVNKVEELDMDINDIILNNKLSQYFNILNVSFYNQITIFEGFIDSLFYPNAIGCCGTNTDFRFLETNELDIQYFFDNDTAGHSKSEEKIKAGFPVFLWKKLFEDVVNKKNPEDPYSMMKRISQIKDLNKLSQLIKNPYSSLKLNNFFSQDEMDLRYIPKKEKKYFRKKDI